jgi:hypothetical protein
MALGPVLRTCKAEIARSLVEKLVRALVNLPNANQLFYEICNAVLT